MLYVSSCHAITHYMKVTYLLCITSCYLFVCLFTAPEVDIVNDKSTWISQELSKSDRPELTSAGKVISGG